jgi:tetratricopeptide (TPR) repeat protein
VQRDIAEKIAGALGTRVAILQRGASGGASNLEAYTLYLRGRYYANTGVEDGLRKGIAYYEKALDADPAYALAYAAIAEAHNALALVASVDAKTVYDRARTAALKALQLDESLAEAHAALGVVKTFYDWDWAGAQQAFERSLAMNPGNAATHWAYAWYFNYRREAQSALQEMLRAQELDPVSILVQVDLGFTLHFARQLDQALAQARRAVQLDPENYSTQSLLGYALVEKGYYKEAIEAFQRDVALFNRDVWALSDLAYGYGASGEAKRALEVIAEIKSKAGPNPRSTFVLALAHVGMFRHSGAFRNDILSWLEAGHGKARRTSCVLRPSIVGWPSGRAPIQSYS